MPSRSPRPEPPDSSLRSVAPHHMPSLLQIDQSALLDVLLLAWVEKGSRIVLVQPEDAGPRDALGGRHARGGADPLPVGVGDRRAEYVDVPALDHGGEGVVPTGRRAIGQ